MAPDVESTVNVFTYLLAAEPSVDGRLPTAVVVNVKAEYLMETVALLSSDDVAEGGFVIVLDEEGRLIGHPSKKMFLSSSLPSELASTAGRSGNESQKVNIDRTKYLVSKVVSEQTGWTFVKATPYREVLDIVGRQRLFIVAICAAFLVVVAGLSILLSRSIYRPIRSLVGHVRRLISEEQEGRLKEDELSFVASAFSDAISRVKTLSTFRTDNIETLRTQLCREILSGGVDEQKTKRRLRELESDLWLKRHFRLMLVRFDLPIPETARETEHNTRRSVSYASAKITSIVASRFCSSVTIDLSEEDTVVIAAADAPISIDAMRQLSAAVNDAMRHMFECTVTTAVSADASALGELGGLYRDVQGLIAYRLTAGPGTFIDSETVRKLVDESTPFPVEIEESLLDSLRCGDRESSLSDLAILCATIDRHSYENVLLGYTRLASSLFDYLNTIEGCGAGERPLRFTEFMQRLASRSYVAEIHTLFADLLDSACEIIRNGSSRKTLENVTRAKELIEQEYANPALSARLVADRMGMSAVYLGRIFRETTGSSIAGYLSRVRLEAARTLLLENGRTAKQISERVGFANTRYFFTKFKSAYGVTPTQYRTGYLRRPDRARRV